MYRRMKEKLRMEKRLISPKEVWYFEYSKPVKWKKNKNKQKLVEKTFHVNKTIWI